MSNDGDCRTAQATWGLLIIHNMARLHSNLKDTVQLSTVQHSEVQSSAVQGRAVQRSAVQCS